MVSSNMETLVVQSPAKINLFLKVTGKRPNGYHNLSSLMCRVSLFDTVTLLLDQPCTTVRCNHPQVPEGKTNLAYKATTLFFDAISMNGGAAVFIDKTIPVGAGLGGGSSNAAAVLTGLNRHYGSPLGMADLMDIGLRVGTDVPFFIFGKTALATGLGEQLEPVDNMPALSAVLVYPRLEISTQWVYQSLNLQLTNCEENYNVSWFLEDLARFNDLLCNDLEQVTAEAFPEIVIIKTALLEVGAMGALMSGSGSAVFGLFESHQQAAASFERLRHKHQWDTFLVDLLLP